ncbi:MAG: hypothetical protein EBR23_10620, partial [Planctomycetia bacterium]|nr:hypothetical protein [Planctomycetia bacterium]
MSTVPAPRTFRGSSDRLPGGARVAVVVSRWNEPITFTTQHRSAKEATKQTVLDPVPEGSKLLPLDLSAAYNDSLQTCFLHPWQPDSGFTGTAGVPRLNQSGLLSQV